MKKIQSRKKKDLIKNLVKITLYLFFNHVLEIFIKKKKTFLIMTSFIIRKSLI